MDLQHFVYFVCCFGVVCRGRCNVFWQHYCWRFYHNLKYDAPICCIECI